MQGITRFSTRNYSLNLMVVVRFLVKIMFTVFKKKKNGKINYLFNSSAKPIHSQYAQNLKRNNLSGILLYLCRLYTIFREKWFEK